MGGSAGCNHYGGKYKANDLGSLKFSRQMTITLMLCDGRRHGIMQQESEYLNLLSNVKGYTIIKHKLILKTNDGRELRFIRCDEYNKR